MVSAVHAHAEADGGERQAPSGKAEARDEAVRAKVWRVRVRRRTVQRHQRQAVCAHDGEQQRQARARQRERQEHSRLAQQRQRARARVQVRRRRQRLLCLLSFSGRHCGRSGRFSWLRAHSAATFACVLGWQTPEVVIQSALLLPRATAAEF